MPAVILFGLPDRKDDVATGAWADNGIVQQAARAMKREIPGLFSWATSASANTCRMDIAGREDDRPAKSLGAAARDAVQRRYGR